ncbi:restriction endonuclease subunit S [Bacteroides sp. 51]|uniref:restriction endonuclease subunit S n=1 Tax=Bacteroides sp. 51 TaxID=2302938 RepID=UPI0013D89187|nr:restriction endonuclease subunit S [Bacteroides sp. 51]NDV84544.1 restriction endonuclease subunit S [Bacteroides sp. 51]
MDTKKLREKILDLAIRGKLVPQDPNDEPATVLVERIREEKERLIKEKKIKRDKNESVIFRGDDKSYYEKKAGKTTCIDGEIPFEVPEGWVWVRLGSICRKIGSGSTPRGSNYSATGIPFLRSQNIHDSGIIYTDIKYISIKTHAEMSGTTVFANDLLLNITGGSLGRCALVSTDFEEANVSQHVCIIRTLKVNNTFLHSYILSPFFQGQIISASTGSGREGLPKYNLENLLISLPPLREQESIISFIENTFSYIDIIQKDESTLKCLIEKTKIQILNLAIQGKLVPQVPTDEPASKLLERIQAEKEALIKVGKIKREKPKKTSDNSHYEHKIPESWEWIKLGDIVSVKGGKRIPKGMSFAEEVTNHIYLRVSDMKNNTIQTNNLKHIDENVYQKIKNYTIGKEDLYLTIAGTIGAVGIIPNVFDNMNLTENAVKLTHFVLIDKKIVMYFILSLYIQEQFIEKTHQVAQPKLAIERILNIDIPLPPLNEQNRIIQAIEQIYSQLNVISLNLKA